MLTYPSKYTVLHCNHLGNTWKPLVLMTRHFDYCLSASEGDNRSVGSSAPVVSRCFPGGYNVKLYISRGRLAWWLLAFLCCDCISGAIPYYCHVCFVRFCQHRRHRHDDRSFWRNVSTEDTGHLTNSRTSSDSWECGLLHDCQHSRWEREKEDEEGEKLRERERVLVVISGVVACFRVKVKVYGVANRARPLGKYWWNWGKREDVNSGNIAYFLTEEIG